MNKLKREMLVSLLEENSNQIFSMIYIKANGEKRKAVCRLHVSNPKHTTKPGTGKYKGISSEEALKRHNNLKYFDLNAEGTPSIGQTPGKGNYRTAKIDRIIEVTIKGIQYILID